MSMDDAARAVTVVRRSPKGAAAATRALAVETPVAIQFDGIGHAVMMATPDDLEDFAVGFARAERLIERADDVVEVRVQAAEGGVLLDVWLAGERAAPVRERARNRLSESGCGLCGVENLEQAMRPLPVLAVRPVAGAAAVFAALAGLRARQPLNVATGAVHAAAWCDGEGRLVAVREDVGRHNALDKLVGWMLREGVDAAAGFVLVTSRCSYEMVEKCVLAGCSMLVAVSAATSLAVERARAAGLTLVALARADAVLVMHDPWGVMDGALVAIDRHPGEGRDPAR